MPHIFWTRKWKIQPAKREHFRICRTIWRPVVQIGYLTIAYKENWGL